MDSSRPCSSFRSIASLGFWFSVYAPRPGCRLAFQSPDFPYRSPYQMCGGITAWRRLGSEPEGRNDCSRHVLSLEHEFGGQMNAFIGSAAVLIALAAVTAADAKGCIKGAAVGAVAGHYSGHHGLLGAAAGCVIGRHEADKRDRMQRN